MDCSATVHRPLPKSQKAGHMEGDTTPRMQCLTHTHTLLQLSGVFVVRGNTMSYGITVKVV